MCTGDDVTEEVDVPFTPFVLLVPFVLLTPLVYVFPVRTFGILN